jgi:hypothetical protein
VEVLLGALIERANLMNFIRPSRLLFAQLKQRGFHQHHGLVVLPSSGAGQIEQFVAGEGIDLITFEKGQRKDDVTQVYLWKFKNNEGVLYVGNERLGHRRHGRRGGKPLAPVNSQVPQHAPHCL